MLLINCQLRQIISAVFQFINIISIFLSISPIVIHYLCLLFTFKVPCLPKNGLTKLPKPVSRIAVDLKLFKSGDKALVTQMHFQIRFHLKTQKILLLFHLLSTLRPMNTIMKHKYFNMQSRVDRFENIAV